MPPLGAKPVATVQRDSRVRGHLLKRVSLAIAPSEFEIGQRRVTVRAAVERDGPLQRGFDARLGDGSERSPCFRYINRNKKGITLDYKQPEGRALFLRLVEGIDALVENYRPTVMPRAGLGVDALREINSQPSAFGSRETGCGSLRT